MFDSPNRYATRGISERLPIQLFVQLWMSVDIQKNAGFVLDYLQIFKFEKVSDTVLAIRHEQEQPERKTVIYCEYQSDFENILNEKIYIIDDGDHSTMLFADEY